MRSFEQVREALADVAADVGSADADLVPVVPGHSAAGTAAEELWEPAAGNTAAVELPSELSAAVEHCTKDIVEPEPSEIAEQRPLLAVVVAETLNGPQMQRSSGRAAREWGRASARQYGRASDSDWIRCG